MPAARGLNGVAQAVPFFCRNMDVRTIRRSEWSGLRRTRYAEKEFSFLGMSGMAGLVFMDEAEDFRVHGLLIAHSGYSWLSLAIREEPVWATVMFDEHGDLFQCYFDITAGNVVEKGGRSRFRDMLLDAVYTPRSRQTAVLDRDELEDAVRGGAVTREEASTAEAALVRLTDFLKDNAEAFCRECERLRDELIRSIQ